MIIIKLGKGREKPLRMGHPWVFSGAIDSVDGAGKPGSMCLVVSHQGECLGSGYFNPYSSIAVRILTLGDGGFDSTILRDRIEHAVSLRKNIISEHNDTCRLVNSEGDFLPGLIIDKYGPGVCVQILTAGMERLGGDIIEVIGTVLAPGFIYERSDAGTRKLERLEKKCGIVTGTLPEQLQIVENDVKYFVDLKNGHKTGFYADQRENRLLFRRYASGRRVLDCFSYTGGFALNAMSGGAGHVTLVDSSRPALDCARRNLSLNEWDCGRGAFVVADVFDYVRGMRESFDLIALDPPKFAHHKSDIDKAARGYKDLNMNALRALAPDGMLFTFSCSQAIDRKLFRQILFAAAADSGRQIQVLCELGAGPDHPVNIAHLEGEYLKGLVLRAE